MYWLQVRVLDKKACGGKVYLKKGVVVDVHPGPIADVSMEEGGRVLQVRCGVWMKNRGQDAGRWQDAAGCDGGLGKAVRISS